MSQSELPENHQKVKSGIIVALYNDDLPYDEIQEKIFLLTGASYGDTEINPVLNKMIADKKIAKVGNVYSMISC